MARLLGLLLFSFSLALSASVPRLPRKALQQHSPDLPAGVLRIDTTAQPIHHAKRQTDSSPITRHLTPNSYWITVSVGRPPQSIPVLLDSGSSDTWFQARNACVTRLVDTCGSYACRTAASRSTIAEESADMNQLILRARSRTAQIQVYPISILNTPISLTHLGTTLPTSSALVVQPSRDSEWRSPPRTQVLRMACLASVFPLKSLWPSETRRPSTQPWLMSCTQLESLVHVLTASI